VVQNLIKPVFFTEISYYSWDQQLSHGFGQMSEREIELSEEVQALCYKAFFETA
jgi:hypothetical protein